MQTVKNNIIAMQDALKVQNKIGYNNAKKPIKTQSNLNLNNYLAPVNKTKHLLNIIIKIIIILLFTGMLITVGINLKWPDLKAQIKIAGVIIVGLIIISGFLLITTHYNNQLINNLRLTLRQTPKQRYLQYFIDYQKTYLKLKTKKNQFIESKDNLTEKDIQSINEISKQIHNQLLELHEIKNAINVIWQEPATLNNYIIIDDLKNAFEIKNRYY